MGLFDKKYCDICGEKIGLLGNRKLEDGNLCKDCARKLSPFFSERRNSTVEDIKRQLAYRAENEKKLAGFEHDLISAADYEKERILGELITANIYKIKKGDDCVIADNWYEGGQTVIKLTENSPQEDAQKHFKKYQKKKRTVSFLNEQKADAERTIDYLESVDAALSCARTVSDVEAIIEELEDEGYIRREISARLHLLHRPGGIDRRDPPGNLHRSFGAYPRRDVRYG